jgi:hypothetical protein
MHNRKRTTWVLISLVAVLTLLIVACQPKPATPPPGEKPNLSIIWFAWPPCEALGELVTAYPDADVTVNCIPIARWHEQIFGDFAARSGAVRRSRAVTTSS